MRECNLNPKWRLEVVHVHVEHGHRDIIISTKMVFSFGKTMTKLRAILIQEHRFFRPVCLAHRNVHAGGYAAQNTKISIDVRLNWGVTKVDLGEMAILFLREIEGELIVNGEIVVTGTLAWISVIMIVGITLFAVITGQSFGAAVATSRLWVAMGCLTIAFTLLTGAAVNGIAPESGQTSFTICTFEGEITLFNII